MKDGHQRSSEKTTRYKVYLIVSSFNRFRVINAQYIPGNKSVKWCFDKNQEAIAPESTFNSILSLSPFGSVLLHAKQHSNKLNCVYVARLFLYS